MALKFVCVFCGGGVGACLRWLLGLACLRVWPAWAAGVTVANVAGSFAIGVAASWFARHAGGDVARLAVITGLLGGFTTFSSFSLEAVQMFPASPFRAGAYVIGHVALCLVAAYIGYSVFFR
jgi:CrcB protein